MSNDEFVYITDAEWYFGIFMGWVTLATCAYTVGLGVEVARWYRHVKWFGAFEPAIAGFGLILAAFAFTVINEELIPLGPGFWMVFSGLLLISCTLTALYRHRFDILWKE